MNARLYDPVLGRMLSPDNYIQNNSFSQAYNGYSYVFNNPMKNIDEDGNFVNTIFTGVIDFATTIFARGGLEFWNKNTFNNAWAKFDPSGKWSKTNKAFQIDKGLLTGDFKDVLIKWTWNLPQTVLGNLMAHGLNRAGKVNGVTHFEGATVLDTDIKGGAYTVGNYITGPKGFKADWKDHLFVHEFGHYLQSQIWGSFYLPAIAAPSLLDAWLQPDFHDTRWYEAGASRRAANWFDRKFGAGANGYVKGSDNFFDIDAFISGSGTPYRNPRNKRFNTDGGHPIQGRFRVSDIFYHIGSLSLFSSFLIF